MSNEVLYIEFRNLYSIMQICESNGICYINIMLYNARCQGKMYELLNYAVHMFRKSSIL